MLDAFQKSECKVSVKMHFLHLHLNYFLDNCGMFSEEQGKRFYQEITVMEERYKGQWNVNMIADYCWYLKRENSSECARKSGRHAFSMIKIPMRLNCFAVNKYHFTDCISNVVIFQQTSFAFDHERKNICNNFV